MAPTKRSFVARQFNHGYSTLMYRAAFELGRGQEPHILDALRVACDCMEREALALTGVRFDARDRLGGDFAILKGPAGVGLHAYHEVRDDGSHLAGLRLSIPNEPPASGATHLDIVLKHDATGGAARDSARGEPKRPLRCTVRVLAPKASDPFGYRAPVLVSELASNFGLSSGPYELLVAPKRLSATEVRDKLVPQLTAEDRTSAVIVCAPTRLTGKPLVTTQELQQAIAGLGSVFVLADEQAVSQLQELLGPWLTCADGAIRAYLAGARAGGGGGDHSVWRPPDQTGGQFYSRVAKFLVSRAPAPDTELTWDGLKASVLSQRAGSLGPHEELALLTERTRELLASLHETEQILHAQQQRVASLEVTIGELRERLEKHEPGTEVGTPPDQLSALTCRSVVEDVARRYPKRVALALNTRSEIDGYPFQDLESLQVAMEFLATTYWESIFGNGFRPDGYKALQEVSGFTFNPHQSDATIGKYRDYYTASWQGTSYELRRHLRA